MCYPLGRTASFQNVAVDPAILKIQKFIIVRQPLLSPTSSTNQEQLQIWNASLLSPSPFDALLQDATVNISTVGLSPFARVCLLKMLVVFLDNFNELVEPIFWTFFW